MTNIKSINRVNGTETTGALKEHRIGSKIAITNFATLLILQRIMDGLATLNGASPIAYDTEPTLADREQLATVGYVLDVATGGSLNFDTQTISGQVAGEDGILVNDLVYFKSSDAKWYKVQADVEATYTGVQVGFSKTEADENETMQVAISGPIKNLSGLTPGDIYYASDTPGEISDTPGTAPFIVGYALSATQLLFTVDFLLPSVKEKAAMSGGGEFGTPSSTNKFVTQNKLDDYISKYLKFGSSSSSGTTQTIAHGLGKTPSIVKIKAKCSSSATQRTWLSGSEGLYNGSITRTIHYSHRTNTDSTPASSSSSNGTTNDYIIYIALDSSGSPQRQRRATISVDSTNITLTWSTQGTDPGTVNFIWEAY